MGLAVTLSSGGGSGQAAAHLVGGPPGPEGIPLQVGTPLAPASTSAGGHPVDGISCDANEQVTYHVHTHLSVYVDGRLRPIPAGIGIVTPMSQPTARGPFDAASKCYYWLHVHAQDGIIHIESPTDRSYTLGDFFDIWGQPLSATQVARFSGHLVVFVNGRRFRGDPADIVLGSHKEIQIDVGSPAVGPKSVRWAGTGL